MDQPTAEQALRRLEPLVGEWTIEATGSDGKPWRRVEALAAQLHD